MGSKGLLLLLRTGGFIDEMTCSSSSDGISAIGIHKGFICGIEKERDFSWVDFVCLVRKSLDSGPQMAPL